MSEPPPGEKLPREPLAYRWIWAVYLLLFALSIPWYAPNRNTLWLGFPYWVVVSLGATLAAAAFTLFVIRRYWESDE